MTATDPKRSLGFDKKIANLMAFLNELKRRNVFRAGGAFLVVMWILLQVTDLVAPALGLPAWVLTAEILLAIIGLPIVLLVSWAYDLTLSGLRRTEDTPIRELGARPSGPGRWAELTVFVILLVAVAYLLTDKLFVAENTESPLTGRAESIAVLPFDNLSGDPDQAYFADGIAEEILNSLAAIPDLLVISRRSSFALHGQNLSTAEIARRLGVNYIVEGSVRRDESTVRITAQLIRATTDANLWSDTFDRPLGATEILRVQESIARNIAERLRVRVIPDEIAEIKPPASLAALDAYMDGRASIRQLHFAGTADFSDSFFRGAIEKMEASVREDPDWAPSQAALGLLWHWWMSSNRDVNFEERWQTSYDYIQRALSIDPDHEPAVASLAFLYMNKGDLAPALDAIKNIGDSTTIGVIMKAYLMEAVGDYEAAIEYYDKAMALDPVSGLFRSQRAASLECAGRFQEVVREIEALMTIAANSGEPEWNGLVPLAYAYAKLGDREKALELVKKWAEIGGPKTEMAPIYAIVGMTDIAESLLKELEDSGTLRIWPIVATAVAIGQVDRAWAQLERIANQDPLRLQAFPCDEESHLLKNDPRYRELRAIAGIPEDYR